VPAAGADVVPGRRLVPEPEHERRSTSRFPDMPPVEARGCRDWRFNVMTVPSRSVPPPRARRPYRPGSVRQCATTAFHGLRTDPHAARDLPLVTPDTEATSPVQVARGPPCVRW